MLGLFAPLLGKADHVPSYLPLLVFGAFGLLGALVALRLPETAGLKLPVTPGVSIPHHYKLKVKIIKIYLPVFLLIMLMTRNMLTKCMTI